MAEWVAIAEKEGGDAEEIQSEEDGSLLLASLANLYRNVTTLKYKGPNGLYRVVRCVGGVLSPPEDSGGWGSHIYICVTRQQHSKHQEYRRKRGRESNNAYAGEEEDEYDPDDDENNWSKSILVHYEADTALSEESFRDCFSQYGEVKCCQMKSPKGDQPGSAFIRFDDPTIPMSLYGKDIMIDGVPVEVKEPETDDKERRKLVIIFRNEKITKQELREHFEDHGKVTDVYIPRPFKFFGFVTFSRFRDCKKLYGAIHKYKGTELRLQEPRAAKEKRQRHQMGPRHGPVHHHHHHGHGHGGWWGGGVDYGPMGSPGGSPIGMTGYGMGYNEGAYAGGYPRAGKRARGEGFGGQGIAGSQQNQWKEMMDNWSNGGQPPAPGTSSGDKRMDGVSFGSVRGGGSGEDKPPCPYRLKHPEQPCLNYEVCSNYYDHGQNYCELSAAIVTE